MRNGTKAASSTELPGYLRLGLRTRTETFEGSGVWDECLTEESFPVAETAILLCDVWDRHWCQGATRRVEALAPVINTVIGTAREHGVQIVHAPSETLDYYAGAPQRQRIQAVPRVTPPTPSDRTSPPLPIDDSDGGCDSGDEPWHHAWTRQHPTITIAGDDVISDDGPEIYSLLVQRGIKNLVFMGVHTNMCILDRSFGIKQMTRWGVRCTLVRDLTDAMYNPKMPPYVSHEVGTELVIQHIEQYWCPSVLSQDLMEVHGIHE